MKPNARELIAACLAMVLLVFAVGIRLLLSRRHEIRSKRMHLRANMATNSP